MLCRNPIPVLQAPPSDAYRWRLDGTANTVRALARIVVAQRKGHLILSSSM